jgi:DcmR-like sensory protein
VHRPWQQLLEEPGTDRHVVQFYEEPSFLQEAVGIWVDRSLARGGGAILVATSHHADLVRSYLTQAGRDPPALEAAGRLVVVDADGLMARFLRAGEPDGERFHALIGELIVRVRAAAPYPQATRIRAWGEMVNLLWQRGQLPAAQRLEHLWNEAIDQHAIHLLCSYQVANLKPETHNGLWKDLSAGHSQLIPQRDEARLNVAVLKALAEAFGPGEAQTLWSLFTARQAGGIGMPSGQAVLVGLHDMLPQLGARVLLRTRHYYKVGA